MEKPLVYTPLPIYTSREEIDDCLASGSWEDVMRLPLALGMNYPDWKYAEKVCVQLAKHSDRRIRVNACLGLTYIARTHKRLHKSIVQPIVRREMRFHQRHATEYLDQVHSIAEALDFLLGWRLQKQRSNKQRTAAMRRVREL